MAQYDPFETDSGLLDDVDVEILEARFEFDERYNSGETLLLKLTVMVDGEEQELMNSCGEGWDTTDGGKTATHPKRQKFIASSGYGMLIDRCVHPKEKGGLGIGDILRKRNSKLGPRDSSIWVGLKFHMNREKVEYGSGIGSKERLLPTKFLGSKGDGKATPVASGDDGGKSDAAAKLEALKKRKGLREQVVALAKECDTIEEFQEKVTAIDGLVDDQDLLNEVLDEGEKGIWAQATAEA